MTPETIQIVRSSWERLAPIADTVASTFYARLFELDPALRPMFAGDMTKHGRMLTSAIGLAVNSLDDFDTLAPAVRSLGRRHAGYGVRDELYDIAAIALLATLKESLWDHYTAAVADAWVEVYTLLAATMKAGARLVAPERLVA